MNPSSERDFDSASDGASSFQSDFTTPSETKNNPSHKNYVRIRSCEFQKNSFFKFENFDLNSIRKVITNQKILYKLKKIIKNWQKSEKNLKNYEKL